MNKKLLRNIRDTKKPLSLHCNAGVAIVNKVGDLAGYGTVWYYEGGIANILPLNNIKKKYCVTYDSTASDCFEVHKEDGTKRVFKPSKKGLFYLSVNNDIVLVTTIEDKINEYSVREYSNAKKARELQNIIGRPSNQDLIKSVERNMISKCPITKQDILRAEDIFGPNLASVKGKTTHTAQEHVQVNFEDLPREIKERHGDVTMAIDVMFINRIAFVITMSRSIHFCTAKLIRDMKNKTLITSKEQVMMWWMWYIDSRQKSKQIGGITFTDKEGNIIMEDDESDANDGPEDVPIPFNDDMDDVHVEGVDESMESTGVDNQIFDIGNTETETGNVETTGVDDNTTGTHVGTEENVETTGVDGNTTQIHVGTENIQKSNTSIQNEENDPDKYVTIGDINIISEMNMSNRQYEAEEEEAEGRTNTRYNLHPKPRNTMHYTMTQSTGDLIQCLRHAHIMMTQLNVREGLKAYGEKVDEAIMKEIAQLHTRKALSPCNRNNMTYDERKKALRYLMFLKEKRDETIKARGCADGRPQHIYTNKEDARSRQWCYHVP